MTVAVVKDVGDTRHGRDRKFTDDQKVSLEIDGKAQKRLSD